jgi:soluble cytochrome b562
MKRFTIVWAAAAGLVAAGFFLSSGSSRADVDKEMYDELSKIAKALQDGDKAKAAQLAKAYSKKVEELGDVMHGFKPRKSKGLGWGTKPGLVDPDGIEKKLDDIDQNGLTDADMKKGAAAFEEGSWMTAAISEFALHRLPEKFGRKGTKKDWIELSIKTRDGAIEMAKAAKSGRAPAFKAAAVKVNALCNNCHSKFKP